MNSLVHVLISLNILLATGPTKKSCDQISRHLIEIAVLQTKMGSYGYNEDHTKFEGELDPDGMVTKIDSFKKACYSKAKK